ncbi:unnamed protein product [Prorocentrum cordatum]|uniref:Uncharacterized protein n=1 Tax=Prorocentrum cordatum TaxID=2364126 RepID=A0ABN9UXT6_9DINO|nr:unnamed protein product [Polarella glacialis]
MDRRNPIRDGKQEPLVFLGSSSSSCIGRLPGRGLLCCEVALSRSEERTWLRKCRGDEASSRPAAPRHCERPIRSPRSPSPLSGWESQASPPHSMPRGWTSNNRMTGTRKGSLAIKQGTVSKIR